MLLCQETYKTYSNYCLVAAESSFILTVIDFVHQTFKTYLEKECNILLSVTHTLYVYEVCHGVGRCVKDESCFSSSLEWKSMDSINGISYYFNKCLDAIKHITDNSFFSFRKTVHWYTCIVQATQSNCCGAVDFLSPEPLPPPTTPSWMHWLQEVGSYTAAWVWVRSQKDWRNQAVTGWILAVH